MITSPTSMISDMSPPVGTLPTLDMRRLGSERHRRYVGFARAGSSACKSPHACLTVNHMVHYQARLDTTFAALSDVTRRGVLEQLGGSDASITDLAQRFRMTLTGMRKHVSILEQAGLVTTEKVGRVRTCKLGLRRLEEEAAWIERHRQLWSARFDALDEVVDHLKREEKADVQRKRR